MTRFTKQELEAIAQAIGFRLAGGLDCDTEEEEARLTHALESAQRKVWARLDALTQRRKA